MVAILIVNQNAREALSLSSRGYVVMGENKFTETSNDLLDNEEVVKLCSG